MKQYRAFGLTLTTELDCPELLPGTGPTDVTIRFGATPQEIPGAEVYDREFQAVPGQLLLFVPRVARFLIRDGIEIIIERDPATTDDEIRLYLLGSGLGAILHQRGLLVLHGATLRVGDGCIAVLGKSGAGKSTLATALHQRGYSCLGDDVCPVAIGADGLPYAYSAYPQAKLWVDSLDHFRLDRNQLRRIRPTLEKRAVPLASHLDRECFPLRKIYVLSAGFRRPTPTLQPVTALDRIQVLRNYTYRGEYIRGLGTAARHFDLVTRLAAQLTITRVVRPTEGLAVTDITSAVADDILAHVATQR